MILPSGRKAGHRAFNKYWKQSLRTTPVSDAVLIHRLIGDYRQLGVYQNNIPGTISRVEAQKRKMQACESLRSYHDYKGRIGIKANHLQKHFRHQNPL